MHRHAPAMLGAAVILALAVPSAAALSDTRAFIPNASITLQLGDEREVAVQFQNPLDRSDTYDVSLSSTPEGAVVATPVRQGTEIDPAGDGFDVDLSAASNHSTTLSLLAASCLGSSCNVEVTVSGRSLETDERFSERMQVTVKRDQDVYGGPGIELLQLLVLAAAATLLVARR